MLLPAFVLRAQALPLVSIEATTRTRAQHDSVVGFGRASHIISGARMAQLEVMQPVEAGARYGMQASAVGALVIWTRGNGPHRSDGRNGGGK